MRHIEILIPFGLPPKEMAPELVRQLNAPGGNGIPSAFATLLSRAAACHEHRYELDEFTGALPHEHWLTRQFGLTEHGNLPLASAALKAFGLDVEPGWWFVLSPVSLHIARDHLVLTDWRQLPLEEGESRSLFESARPFFEEAGYTVVFGDARTWFLRADGWVDLQTSTPDAACGHNIDIWMPTSKTDSRSPLQWRKVQNEIHMLWHMHEVNEARQYRGESPVNSLWLWGGSNLPVAAETDPFARACNLPPLLQGLRTLAGQSCDAQNANELLAMPAAPGSGRELLFVDELNTAAMANNWMQWLTEFHQLEHTWFAPLLEALKNGKLDRISLILNDSVRLISFTANRASLRKFWIKPSLNRLLS